MNLSVLTPSINSDENVQKYSNPTHLKNPLAYTHKNIILENGVP
jgi:hypothetical protein